MHKIARVHEILSRAHEILSRAHEILSRAHQILSREHQILSRAHEKRSIIYFLPHVPFTSSVHVSKSYMVKGSEHWQACRTRQMS